MNVNKPKVNGHPFLLNRFLVWCLHILWVTTLNLFGFNKPVKENCEEKSERYY